MFCTDIFTIWNRINFLSDAIWHMDEPAAIEAREEYKQYVQKNIQLFSVDAPAGMIDPWMADTYSDLYKDRYGFRPRGHSYLSMKQWMDNIPPLYHDDDDDLWVEEYNPSDRDESEIIRALDFKDVYGISVMDQAMKFMDVREY
jgi:hypothetical protein